MIFFSFLKHSTNIKTIIITLFLSFRISFFLNNNQTALYHTDIVINRYAITFPQGVSIRTFVKLFLETARSALVEFLGVNVDHV